MLYVDCGKSHWGHCTICCSQRQRTQTCWIKTEQAPCFWVLQVNVCTCQHRSISCISTSSIQPTLMLSKDCRKYSIRLLSLLFQLVQNRFRPCIQTSLHYHDRCDNSHTWKRSEAMPSLWLCRESPTNVWHIFHEWCQILETRQQRCHNYARTRQRSNKWQQQ